MEKKYTWECFMALLLIVAVSVIARNLDLIETVQNGWTGHIVIVDAGHGGVDPGKIGINNALEKDLNLSIALKLKDALEASGITVIMTRTDDNGLYDETASNKKQSDMQKRCAVITQSNCTLAVSIHQNSYHTSDVNGPQVFYYSSSVKGQKIADIMQKALIEVLKPAKERVAKANDTYYLLKKVSCPIVIVECGFLSNQTEADKLTTSEYQELVASAIHMGIMQYLNEMD